MSLTASGGARKRPTTRKRVAKRRTATTATRKRRTMTTRKRVATRKVSTGGKRKLNPAMLKKFKPDAALAAIAGSASDTRQQFMKKVWNYIKKKGLQGTVNKREIIAKKDAAFRKFTGKDVITMFEVMKILNKHIA